MEPKRFALMAMLAQEIHENSWSGNSYATNKETAAKMAADRLGIDHAWVQPVYFLNQLAWNDIQDWAKDIVAQ